MVKFVSCYTLGSGNVYGSVVIVLLETDVLNAIDHLHYFSRVVIFAVLHLSQGCNKQTRLGLRLLINWACFGVSKI